MYLIIQFLFIGLLFLIISYRKSIFRPFGKIKKITWISLSAAMLILLVLYWSYIPNIHRVYGDEPTLLSEGAHPEYQAQTNFSVSALYNLVFTIFGLNNIYAIKLNIILAILDLLLLFLVMYLLFNDEMVAFFSSVFLGIYYHYMLAATSSYTQIITLFYALSAVLFFWQFIKNDKPPMLVICIISLTLLIFARIEMIVFIPVFIFWWIILKRKYSGKYWLNNIIYWILLILMIPFYRDSVFAKMNIWINTEKLTFGLDNIKNTLFKDLPGTLMDGFFGKAFFIISIISLFICILVLKKQKRLKEALFMFSIICALIPFYLFNSYFTAWYLVIMAPFFIYIYIIPFSALEKSRASKMITIGFLLLILILQTSYSISKVWINTNEYNYISTHAPHILEEHFPNGTFLNYYQNNIRMGSYLKTRNLWQKNLSELKDMVENRVSEEIYLFMDFGCLDPYLETTTAKCEYLLNNFNFTPVMIIYYKDAQNTVYKLNSDLDVIEIHLD